MMKEIPTSYQSETYADLNNQLKGLTEDLHSTKESKEQITQRCHELDMQVNIIKKIFLKFLMLGNEKSFKAHTLREAK